MVAAWREALLAQKVLRGETRGYTRHPQLERFRDCADPLAAIGVFLAELAAEGRRRGYSFDESKISHVEGYQRRIPVGSSQVAYELELLKAKLEIRAPGRLREICDVSPIRTCSIFTMRDGDIEAWERPLPEILVRMKK